MRSEYYDPIERLPDKIDQLIERLNLVRVYLIFLKRFFIYRHLDAA